MAFIVSAQIEHKLKENGYKAILAEDVDFTDYTIPSESIDSYTKEHIDSSINNIKSSILNINSELLEQVEHLNGEDSRLNGLIDANTTKIETIESTAGIALETANTTKQTVDATKSELVSKINEKQDALIAGDNIKIENNVISSIGAAKLLVSTTWSELKALRDNSQLVTGTWYRITDYTCTTTKKNTRSAGHPFDIIVRADSENKLNEEAFAIQHEGDDYFASSNLSAWKLWYSLDNDTTRFEWADSTNGKGVIYRMIDEFNNDVPYDFKNIQFYRKWDSSKSLWSTISNDNTGVPCYTFSSSGSSSTTSFTDMSLSISNGVFSNVIKECISIKKQTLNNICFFGKNCKYNSFENECYSNSFGNECYYNSFGNDCRYNSFGNYCISNSFGNYCDFNSFGNNCQYNSFGNYCRSNSFGNYCISNSFGNYYDFNSFGNNCQYNSFGNNCSNNSFGNNCSNNSFGIDCKYNSFGNNCSKNSFGNVCYSNSFRNDCNSNSFGNYCNSNSFRNDCYYNSFGNDCQSNSFGNNCDYNSFRISTSETSALKDYVYYNHFDDGCAYNVIWNSDTTSSTVILQNINVNRGVVGTESSYNMINIDVLNSEQEINVNQVDGIVSIGNILSITYESLKTLRDNAQLIPGKQYRIIDYITTTSQENTRSARHQFDIIVTALDERTLSEEAQAIQNSNEEYFDGSNLSAWKIWYCLDNDTNRFAWAGDEMVGVIEHKVYNSSTCTINPELIDGNAFITPFNFESCVWVDGNNDGAANYGGDNHDIDELIYEWGHFTDENGDTQLCIYKSDAELYEAEGQPDYGDKYLYRGVITVDSTEYDYWQKWDEDKEGIDFSGDYVYATTQRIVSNPEAYSVSIKTAGIYEPGKGVIYRMIDEWNNDVPYDFKNINFKRYIIEADNAFATNVAKGGEIDVVKEMLKEMSHKIHTDLWYYGEYVSNVYPDANPEARYVPFGDVGYENEGPQVICLIDENNYGWFYTFHNEDEDASLLKPNVNETIGVCDNTIKDSCYVFLVEEGTGSYYPTKINAQSLNNIVFFGNYCNSNSFGNDCNSNSFGNNCYYNSFGNYCYYNSFGNNCNSNSFGNNCNYNSFGNDCNYNSFGNDCNYNSFGNDCNYNSFGNYCNANSFGNKCNSNSFGNYCNANSFGNKCNSNSFGNNCNYNSFGNYCNYNSLGNNCYYNSFGNYCYYNSFGNNCNSNSFGNNCNYNSFGNNCNYIMFASDSSASTKYNYYQSNHFGDCCEYIVLKGAGDANSSKQLQNYNFAQGVQGTDSNYLIIDGVRNLSYETKVAKNSSGELKIYCEADLVS